MSTTVRNLQRKLTRLRAIVAAPKADYSRYRMDPAGYSKDVLGVTLTPDQEEMLLGMVTPPFRVLGRAGHTVGKSKGAAVGVSWLFDTRDPAMIISTAPRLESVKNIIWRELHSIRQRAGLGGFKTSSSLTMQTSPNHFAIGMTARNTYGFHGKHELNCFIILDEATGIEPEFWDAADSMLNGAEYGLLAIYNPFSTASRAWEEEQKDRNKVVVMSCLNHPNIRAELQGLPAPYPSAVRYEWVDNAVKEWSDRIEEADRDDTKGDFEWPPKTIQGIAKASAGLADVPTHTSVLQKNPPLWYRPGPLCRIRVRGEWPSEGIDTVWSEVLFEKCRANRVEIMGHWRTAIGCDVARFGDDMTCIVVRQGACVVHMEEHGGWDTSRTLGRLKSLAYEYRGPEDEHRVRVFVDEPGMGAGVLDYSDGWNFIAVNPSSKSSQGAETKELLNVSRKLVEYKYVNMRTQLWFDAKNIAQKEGLMDLSKLPRHQAAELKRQLMAQAYSFRSTDGAIQCTEKEKVKEEIKRSPDLADALNLAFCRVAPVAMRVSQMG